MRAPGSLRPLLTVAALLLVTSGCLNTATPEPKPTPTPIDKLRTGSMIIPRQGFCGEVPTSDVRAAIKGPVDNQRSWTNGEQGITGDVDQEFGCEWKSADGLAARAWVFARPVTAAEARGVIAKTSRASECHAPPPVHFGKPSQIQVCKLGGGVLRVRYAGLFGDTFLSCELAEPTAAPAELRRRAGDWCVAVATALDTNG